MEFGFLSDHKLLGFLFSLVVLAVFAYLTLRKSHLLKQLKIKPLISKFSFLVFIFLFLTLSLTVLRPYYGKYEIKVPSKYSNIIIAVDISDSMLARDVFPSRLEAAKRELFDLVAFIKAKNKPYKLGIVLFAGSAYSYCPATKDLNVVSNYIRSIDNRLIETGGSDIELGLKASIAAFKSSKVSSGQVIIMTDGEDEEFNISGFKSAASELDIRIGILGIGEDKAVPLIKNGRPLKDPSGNQILSVLNETLLKQIAAEVGGRYSRAFLNDSDIKNILFVTDAEKSSLGDDTFVVHKEYSWLISLFILLSLTILMALKRFTPVHFVLLFASLFFHQANTYAESPSKGADLYRGGDYSSAEKVFGSLSQEQPEESKYLHAWGNSLYRQKKFDQAESAFRASEHNAKNGRDAFKASYNLGNSLLMQQRFNEAIDAYEKSLTYKENDKKAKFNLELARKMLEQQKQQEEEQKDKEQKSEEEKSEQEQEQEQKENNSDQQEQDKEDSSDSQDESENSESKQESDNQDKESEENSKEKEENKDSEEESQEEEEKEEQQPAQAEQDPSEQGSENLEQREAKAWLDSLSESPLLLRRDGYKGTPKRQTW